MTIQQKIKYYWDIYGISISYDIEHPRYTRTGHPDYRYCRYVIKFPYMGQEGISLCDPLRETIRDVKGSFIDYYIEQYFKKYPNSKEAFKNEMIRIKQYRGK